MELFIAVVSLLVSVFTLLLGKDLIWLFPKFRVWKAKGITSLFYFVVSDGGELTRVPVLRPEPGTLEEFRITISIQDQILL